MCFYPDRDEANHGTCWLAIDFMSSLLNISFVTVLFEVKLLLLRCEVLILLDAPKLFLTCEKSIFSFDWFAELLKKVSELSRTITFQKPFILKGNTLFLFVLFLIYYQTYHNSTLFY